MSDSNELKPTTGAERRAGREKGAVLIFPSGEKYRVRRVTAQQLLRRGKLPNVLLGFLIDAIYNGMTQEKIDNFFALRDKEESVLEWLDSLKIVCQEMWMEPRIVDDPKSDDEMTIDDVDLLDQAAAFEVVFKPAKQVLPFRPQQEAAVGGMAEVETGAPSSERRPKAKK